MIQSDYIRPPLPTDERTLYEMSPVGHIVTSRSGLVLGLNLTGAQLLGRPRGDILGKPFLMFVEPEQRDAWREHLLRVAGGSREELTLQLRRNGSGSFPAELTSQPLREGLERIGGLHATFQDVSRKRRQEDEQSIVHRAFQSTHEGVVITDLKNRIVYINEGFTRATGYTPDEAIGHSPALLNSGFHDAEFYKQMWDSLKRTGAWQGQVWNRRKNGDVYPEWLNITAVHGKEGRVEHYIGVFSDLSARDAMQQNLHQLAFYDTVTGLPNRHLFSDRLEQAIAQAGRIKQRVGVMFIDLDRFKLINDTLGHRAGDRLLTQVGHRLTTTLRDSDTVSRMGGDEFNILLPALRSRANSVALAGKLLEAFKQPFDLEGSQYYLGASIGLAHYPDDGGDPDSLIKNADTAMYQAKELGGNTYFLYQRGAEGQEARAARRLDLENGLREALDHGQFELHFQPQVEVTSGRVQGVEALIRWRHPVEGLISPAEFLPLAEETGLIGPIGTWVLGEACRTLADWKTHGMAGVRMAVNLSPHQFLDKALPNKVAEALAEHGLCPDELELEVTESAAMPNLEHSLAMLGELRGMGLRVAIDDFGTGYSSLSQLKSFPISCLKVDQSFVRDIPENAGDSAIAATIIHMAHLLKLEVVAEGVERPEQLTMLKAEGCHLVQGYFYSRPLPAAEALALLLAPPWRNAA